MISFSTLKETVVEAGIRIAKVVQFGAKTADVVSSFGDDSAPLKDMTAIYAGTSEVGDNIIIGYINKNQIAADGEKRIFSLKEDGSLSFSIHLKNDGTCEIGGNDDYAVRYSKLEEAFNELRTDLNNLVTAYNGHTHVSASPGSPNSPTPTQGQASTADITPSRVDNVKLPS